MQLSSELSSMIQCIQCCCLLRIIITRKIDRDREIQRERMKAIPPEGFLSFFCSTDHQRSLAPLCLLCCQLVCKNGSTPTLLEPGRATHNQQALELARNTVDVNLSGAVTTHYLIHSSGSFSSPSLQILGGGGACLWGKPSLIFGPPLCSPSIFAGIKTKSMSSRRELIPVALCFVWAPPPLIIQHQSAMGRMKGPQSD